MSKITSVLEDPIVTKELINESDIELQYRDFFNTTGKIYRVTVTPKKNPKIKAPVHTFIQMPIKERDGCLEIQNLGRTPFLSAGPLEDDLRPITYYVAGTGKAQIRVNNRNLPSDFKFVNLEF